MDEVVPADSSRGTPRNNPRTMPAVSGTLAARLALALDVARLETWEVDLESGEFWWSHHCPEFFGFSPEVDVTWEQLEATIHPDDRERARDQRRSLLHDGTPLDYTIRVRAAGQDERVLQVRADVVRDEAGQPSHAIGVTQDVTEERRRDAELRTSRARLALAHEIAGLTSWELNARTGERLWVHRPAAVAPEARGALDGMGPADWREAVHLEDRARLDGAFAQLVRDRQPLNTTFRMTDPIGLQDAGERIHHLRAVVLTDSGGEPESIVGTKRDVTDEQRAAAVLRASEERLRLLLEAAETGFAFIEGRDTLFANQAFLRFIGYSQAEFDALSGRLDFLMQGDREDAMRSIDAMRRGDIDRYQAERRFLRRDGSVAHAQVWARTVSIGRDRTALLFQVLDITERKKAAEALRRLHGELQARSEERQVLLQRLLEAEDESRRRVAFDIHDGPAQQLTGADMFLEAFRERRAAVAAPEVERLLDLAKAHLRTALLETRRIMSDLRPASLDDFGLESALRTSFTETAARSGCSIEFSAAADGPRLRASAEIALFRIAQEAVSNAVRHSGSSVIRVVLHSAERGTIITVRDWGRGIQPRSSGHRRGLGLISMRERAELFGGSFGIDSAPGRGTTISVRLPPGLAAPKPVFVTEAIDG